MTARRRRTPRPRPPAPASCPSLLDGALRRRVSVLDLRGGAGDTAGCQGDPEGERRADALLAPDRHRSAVVAGHVLDDGQAQPGAAGTAGPRLVDPVEA